MANKSKLKLVATILLLLQIGFVAYVFQFKKIQVVSKAYATATVTATVSLTVSVLEYLAFSFTAGGTVAFGSLTPGTPICSTTASVGSVTSNSANGYAMYVMDGKATGSALVKGTAFVPDFNPGSLWPATPVVWGSNTGLGVSLFADSKTLKNTTTWGAGTTVCDALNQYSGIPQANSVTPHYTKTGFDSAATTASYSWKIDVPNTQETGNYTGSVTFTVVNVLS